MSDGFYNDPEGRPTPSGDGPPAQGLKIGRVVLAAAVVGVALYLGLSFFSRKEPEQAGQSTTVPLVRADPEPAKVAPDQPGGMDVPNQDKLIYDKVAGVQTPTTEQLLPPPDTPLPRPAGPEAAGVPAPMPAQQAPQPAAPAQQQAQPQSQPAPLPQASVAPPPAAKTPPLAPAPQDRVPGANTPTNLVPPAAKADKPADQPKVAAVIPPPKPAAPAAGPVTAGSYQIQIAAMKDQASAQAAWIRAQKANSDLLGSLKASYQPVQVGGNTLVRLRAGPFASRDAAAEACVKLKQRNLDCNVVR